MKKPRAAAHTPRVVPPWRPLKPPPTHVPTQAPAGRVPSPRRPGATRAAGDLGDLFAMFPDLPRPARRIRRTVSRRRLV